MTALTRADTDAQLIEVWLRGRSEHTQRAYRTATTYLREWTGAPLRSLALDDLQGWLADQADDGYSVATIRARAAAVCSLLSFGEKAGYLPFNVGAALKIPSAHQNPAERILTELEVQQIFEALEGRDRLLAQTLYITGVRVSELVRMRWADCHEHDRGAAIQVIGKGDKRRFVDVPAKLWLKLRRQRDDSPWIWPSRQGEHLTPRRVRQILSTAAELAGVEGNVSPHWLRHSCATHALNRGAPLHVVQKKLGHASLATTQVYANLLPGDSLSDYLPEI